MQRALLLFAIAAATATSVPQPARGATAAGEPGWQYMLLDGSTFLDDCPICGRPSILRPMRGTFQLVLENENPLFSRYGLCDISFRAPGFGADDYLITGTGTYRFGGEVAYIQEMLLDVQINGEPPEGTYQMQNDDVAVSVGPPMIDCSVRVRVSLALEYTLHIIAAPCREIWFSTENGLTPGNADPRLPSHITGADVLSSDGRVVAGRDALLASIGLDPQTADARIDALDVGPGGEVLFSLLEDAHSSTLGPIGHGDLLSNRGQIVKRNHDLLEPFLPMLPIPDLGLDALDVLSPKELLFSVRDGFFSQRLGQFVGPGDLLSAAGEVVRTNKELLARFHPAPGTDDCGLDACFFFQPDAAMLGTVEEIWFSTERGFEDGELGPIVAGDLLSAQGRIVRRNLELVSPFAPLEDLADFGLDGLFVVTDAFPASDPPRIVEYGWDADTGQFELRWEGAGCVFQVECAPAPAGPYAPASAIMPALDASVIEPPAAPGPDFFRVQQW